ncbi:MAG: hypothetical protein PHR26_04015 [Candidatus ainarchaeum sp.]|nr:hypothetical protein [Candidatus ainarchaeum sp.]MDD3975620.1 hypothetical protein [Candidatus ainarchaeum sp.]
MTETIEIINIIEQKSNEITAKLEILRTLEEQKIGIDEDIKKAKDKLKNEDINKFTYGKMQEINQKNLEENTNERKKIWNEIADHINMISDRLNILKENYNKKAEIQDTPKIVEEKK